MVARCGDPLPGLARPLFALAYGPVHQFYDVGQQWCDAAGWLAWLRGPVCRSRAQWDWEQRQ